jgi:hypothetical protein
MLLQLYLHTRFNCEMEISDTVFFTYLCRAGQQGGNFLVNFDHFYGESHLEDAGAVAKVG